MRRLTTLAIIAAAGLPFAAPDHATAAAGTFTNYGYGTPEQDVGPAGEWVASNIVGNFSEASALTCATTGSMAATNGAAKFASSGYGFFVNDGASLTFAAPTNTYVSRLSFAEEQRRRRAMARAATTAPFPCSQPSLEAALSLIDSRPRPGPCFGIQPGFGKLEHDVVRDYPGLNDAWLRFDVRCTIDRECNALGSEPIGITIDRAEIALTKRRRRAPSSLRRAAASPPTPS